MASTPKLNLDFTSAVLDSRIAFSRPLATATRINSNGFVEAITADTPRFDFDPITLACKGLLVEESRSNSLTYSENFTIGAPWTVTGAAVTISATTSPIKDVFYNRLTEDAANTVHQISRSVSLTIGTTYSLSVFAKAGERNLIRIGNAAQSGGVSTFNLTTGVVQAKGASNPTADIEPYADGYRCWVTFTPVGTNNALVIAPTLSNFTGTYQGDGTSGIYIVGAQLEVGAFATSYIPTTTTSLTRNADVATITGTNFSDWWQAGKGGVLVRARPSTVSGTRPWVQFDDGTADNLIAIRGNGTNPELYIVDSTTPQAQIDAGTIAANTDYAMTAWWNTDDCKARLNSGAVVSDTSATIPTVDQMRIGSDGTNYLNGHIASIGYYDRFSSQIYTRRKNKAVFSLL